MKEPRDGGHHPGAWPAIRGADMSESTSIERWMPIPGFDGYQVSDLGNVWSNARTIVRRDGIQRWQPGQLLRTHDARGYRRVSLQRDGRVSTQRVHRLVLEAFVGPCPAGMECCHGPGGPADNRLVNLRWDTPSENNRDAVRQGTHHRTARTHCPRGHELSEANNTPKARRVGRRECLACHRAHTCALKARQRGHVVGDLYATADAHYVRFTAGQCP